MLLPTQLKKLIPELTSHSLRHELDLTENWHLSNN